MHCAKSANSGEDTMWEWEKSRKETVTDAWSACPAKDNHGIQVKRWTPTLIKMPSIAAACIQSRQMPQLCRTTFTMYYEDSWNSWKLYCQIERHEAI